MFVYVEHSRRCLFCRPRALLLLILDIKALAACRVIKTKLPMKWFISVFITIEVFKFGIRIYEEPVKIKQKI